MAIRNETIPLDHLLPDERNPRRHSAENIQRLASRIQAVGFTSPVLLVEETGILAAGHRRRLALRYLRDELHRPEPDGIEEGWGVPARVGSWSEIQALQVLAGDNGDPSELEYDDAGLTALLAELQQQQALEGAGYTDEDLDRLIGELAGQQPGGGLLPDADPDAVPEAVETRCQVGDLWKLGEHRLLCGDSTKAEDVARLMGGEKAVACITDPPYNVGLDYDEATDDQKAEAEYKAFSLGWWEQVTAPTKIVTPGWNNLAFWLVNAKPQASGVWTKLNAMTRASASRFNCWEPILFYGCQNSDRAHDVFDFPTCVQYGGRGTVADPHPCPKPEKLWAELFNCYTSEGALIYEPFCGSGTALIVGSETGRKVLAMEHSAHYCDISLTRWELATGQTAELLERVN